MFTPSATQQMRKEAALRHIAEGTCALVLRPEAWSPVGYNQKPDSAAGGVPTNM